MYRVEESEAMVVRERGRKREFVCVCVASRLECRYQMSLSSLGRGRPGLSAPRGPVCLLSSALGRYIPSILLFFLITQPIRTRARHSSKVRPGTNTDHNPHGGLGNDNTIFMTTGPESEREEGDEREKQVHRQTGTQTIGRQMSHSPEG